MVGAGAGSAAPAASAPSTQPAGSSALSVDDAIIAVRDFIFLSCGYSNTSRQQLDGHPPALPVVNSIGIFFGAGPGHFGRQGKSGASQQSRQFLGAPASGLGCFEQQRAIAQAMRAAYAGDARAPGVAAARCIEYCAYRSGM